MPRGGARPNSGPKKKADKKVQVSVGVLKSRVKKLGGLDKVKKIMREAIS